tara:strand:- start:40 stop:675 length:636 start_codon:yes stop_codon:yes gene_type:complete
MEYNSQRGFLRLKEYGRHIQNLVEYAISIPEKEKRQDVIDHVIHIMGNLNPHLKNVEDFKHLLWDHLHIMADFKLDVDSPYPLPDKDVLFAKPEQFYYPIKNRKYRHYGKNILSMIEKASEMEDGETKSAFTKCIANYMKIVHNNWNSDTVTDETIINDLAILSKQKLHLDENIILNKVAPNKKKYVNSNRNNRQKSKNYSNKRKNYTRSK